MIQGFVESAVRDYEARLIQRQKEAAEAAQREEERQRLLAEEEARRKKEEEERKAKVVEEEERMKREKEESEARERICALEKVKEIAEQDPAFLEASGLQVSATRTTYPAVDGGKCERCMNRNLVCLGLAGKTCKECARLHCTCSNNATRMRPHFFFLIFLLNVLLACKVSDEPDTADVEGPKPGERPKPRRTRQSPTRSTTSSSAAKRKVKFDDDDDAPDSNVTTRVSKRAKVSHDEGSLLSRAEAAEVVAMVTMELQGIQDALDRTQEALAHFTSRANGKRRVAIKGSS